MLHSCILHKMVAVAGINCSVQLGRSLCQLSNTMARPLLLVHVLHTTTLGTQVYLFGGAVISWKQPSGDEILYVRPDAKFDGSKPISGGIPHYFPQVCTKLLNPTPNPRQQPPHPHPSSP